MTKIKSWQFSIGLILFLTLTNYQLAKLIQRLVLYFFPSFSYQMALVIPWLLIAVIPIVIFKSFKELQIDSQTVRKNILDIALICGLVTAGLLLFVFTGITKYFHSVQYPLIFFIATPIIEELIFRGWMFTRLEKLNLRPIISTSLLFGLHHLQYFRYVPTPFAIFQMTYTFFLGLLFARLRKKSGNLYISILLHIFINWVTVSF